MGEVCGEGDGMKKWKVVEGEYDFGLTGWDITDGKIFFQADSGFYAYWLAERLNKLDPGWDTHSALR